MASTVEMLMSFEPNPKWKTTSFITLCEIESRADHITASFSDGCPIGKLKRKYGKESFKRLKQLVIDLGEVIP